MPTLPTTGKRSVKAHGLKAGCFFGIAKGFSWSIEVLYGGQSRNLAIYSMIRYNNSNF
jgi:hypothetical protein